MSPTLNSLLDKFHAVHDWHMSEHTVPHNLPRMWLCSHSQSECPWWPLSTNQCISIHKILYVLYEKTFPFSDAFQAILMDIILCKVLFYLRDVTYPIAAAWMQLAFVKMFMRHCSELSSESSLLPPLFLPSTSFNSYVPPHTVHSPKSSWPFPNLSMSHRELALYPILLYLRFLTFLIRRHGNESRGWGIESERVRKDRDRGMNWIECEKRVD